MFYTFLYQPFLNVFFFLYNLTPGQSIGITIVLLTVLVRLAIYPLIRNQMKSQKAMQDLQPKLKALQEEYKEDKEAQAKALMNLYKDNKVNPLSSCLPLLIQLPVFFTLYRVFVDGLTKPEVLNGLYNFVSRPEIVNTHLFALNLAEPSYLLAGIAAFAQFIQGRMLSSKRPKVKTEGSQDEDTMALMNKQMTFILPIIILFFGANLPGGLALYWITNTALMIVQQYFVFNKKSEETDTTQISEGVEVIKNK